MSFLVYIPQDIEKEGKEFLKEKGYDYIIGSDLSQETLIREVKDCDAILTRSNAMITEHVINAGKKLKVIAKYGVGLDNIDIEAATKRGIYVTNTPEANANVVAEHVMALMLALSKNLLPMDKELRKGNFAYRTERFSVDLEHKTLGIVGLGRIGRLVAKKARYGFDMKVIGYDPYMTATIPEIEKTEDLNGLLQNSDFISLHLPLTKDTKGVIGSEQFKWMKPSAYLINAARGGVVNENDLAKALREGVIAGAGIDVFEQEPPNPDNPLFSLDNAILTPHSAALSTEGAARMSLHAAMQVDEALKGEIPRWAVNEVTSKTK
ncbi:hydroxyacid dehydrogenase [Siminovitchia sediminis]|uniref:Hydroxyacid dehydrogenase n=1 Tax=Siminovitchia sediminis TaxID=1274353 RepID=A0ABW4KGC3_9BACI